MREGTCSNLNGVICQSEDPLQNLVFVLSLRKQLIDCVVFVPLTSFQIVVFFFIPVSVLCYHNWACESDPFFLWLFFLMSYALF